jgi:transposase-like protein
VKQPNSTKAWVNAGIVLANDPTKLVPCPDCGEANLNVHDACVEGSDHFSRYMWCPSCKSRNILLGSRNTNAAR